MGSLSKQVQDAAVHSGGIFPVKTAGSLASDFDPGK
jgi:hypothetical protein